MGDRTLFRLGFGCQRSLHFLAMSRYSILFMIVVVLALSLNSCKKEYADTATVIRDAVKDYDGNKYDAVKIGDQIWMASNLRTKHFADGEKIPFYTDGSSLIDPMRYSNGEHNNGTLMTQKEKRCGFLYNWCAVMHNASQTNVSTHVQGVCPNGWHVPTEEEWKTLRKTVASSETYMNKSGSVSKALADRDMWKSIFDDESELFLGVDINACPAFNTVQNNSTGFSALPAGNVGWISYCPSKDMYYEYGVEYGAYFWTCTSKGGSYASIAYIYYDNDNLYMGTGKLDAGLSVRCVRD